MAKFIIVMDYYDKESRRSIQVEAPDDWGKTEEEVAIRLAQELNNEEEMFLAIGNKTIKKIFVEGATIYNSEICYN